MRLTRRPLTLATAAFTLTTGLALAQAPAAVRPAAPGPPAPPASSAPLTATIPIDPSITTGRLPNGLRYYVRANAHPEDRAELRLVVNVGSILEDDDQRGLAHFVEHMAFNGTKNFPKLDIINFIESIGMKFGADLNASTSFDETIYKLQVPTDKPEVLDKAMLVLEDWAHNVTFDPVEIDKERGVVIEEWRLGRGAAARMWDKQAPILFQNSRYATRLPIGLVDILQHFKPERLTQFYKDWYRPDLMAVVAVGDFDKTAIEALIRKHFTAIPAAASPRPRIAAPVPGHAGTTYAIATDVEARSTSVSVYNTMPVREQTTIAAYRRQIVENLYSAMLSSRLAEIAQKPDAPFLGAGVDRGLLVRTSEASFVEAAVKDGGVERGLDALFTETERVARFGFTATELARAKTNALRSMERAVAEKDRQESSSLVAEYGRNFTTREPIPGIVYEQALYQRFVPGVTLAEINALAKTWSPDRNRVVLVNAPQKNGVPVPTPAALAAVMNAAAGKDLTAYVDTTDAQPLLASVPTAGGIVSTATKDPYGITEWTLSNGVHVVLKPTDFKQDEVLFRAVSPGGTSLASDQDFIAADTADQVVAAGGLGSFSSIDLRKVLTGKVASASPGFTETDTTLSGGGSAKDLETMFQLIYLRFTQPRPDPVIFGVFTEQVKAQLANQSAQPEFAFEQTMNGALTQNHPRAVLMTPDLVDRMNLDKSLAFYKDRFADASNFTFVFVGSFDVPTMKPLVEQYLASLPATHRNETWKDMGIEPPAGIVDKRVEKGIEPKSETRIVFSGPFEYDQAHRAVMRAMTTILTERLREVLREDLGGTYSVQASSNYAKVPKPEYRVTIAFGSDPQRADALAQRVFEEIQKFKAAPPSAQAVSDIKETFLRDLETSNRQNAFFLRELSVRYEYNENLDDLFGLDKFYRNLTPAAIQDAAVKYLDTTHYVKGTLVPAK